MHTLKTTIVVVLLLTVTYSAYVALTAPPAELTPELKDLIEASEDDGDFALSIDPGTSSSFGGDLVLPPPLDSSGAADPAASPSMNLPGMTSSPTDMAGTTSPADAGSTEDDALAYARLTDQDDLTSHGPGDAAEAPADTAAVMADPAEAGITADLALASGSAADSAQATAVTSGYDLPDVEAASAEVPQSAITQTKLANAIATADRQCEQQQLREALATLSVFYNTPDLSEEDRSPLLARLDFLAGEVIYSTRHLLEQPYRVSQGDTLKTIAATLEVPWELLATVNGATDPAAIVPGQQLKAIRGPFRAEVNLERQELTLFLGELYAGRFPINLGTEPTPSPGNYSVLAKDNARTYYPLGGANIPAGDPRNPYGDVWMDLGNQMCIHGSPDSESTAAAGCIQLRKADAKDLSGILSLGSEVSILR